LRKYTLQNAICQGLNYFL